ncbi:MAG: UMP kinase [Nanoarchaeota archaeon]
MKKEKIVLSLGGSQIIPENINYKYLKEFKKVILKNKNKFDFIIVCGGGSIARKYISSLEKEKISTKLQSFAGISITRANARFVSYFFNKNTRYGIPHTFKTLRKYLKKQGIVFCGALEYHPNQTSDSTSARIAKKFNARFINLTNVKGLYNKNPKTNKNAKLVNQISWKNFHKIATKIEFKPGQHFVLDQKASKIILKKKILTYILKSPKQLDNLLKDKKFIGTTISG